MTRDAGYTEQESIEERKQQAGIIIREAMKNHQERTWDFWEALVINNSRRLSLEGIHTLHWARTILENTLGLNFLQIAATDSADHPIFVPNLWPIYDLPHSYANLFELAAEIELLQTKDGWSLVRNALRRDFQSETWESSLLQLEIAGLSLQAGWHIELERPLPNRGRTDVTLTKESAKFLVETKAIFTSEAEQLSDAYFFQMRDIFWNVAWKYGVRITSDSIGSPLPADEQIQWIEEIKETASNMGKDGETITLQGPRGGQVTITKTENPGVSPFASEVVKTNVGSRLIRKLRDKNEQYEGAQPAWVYVGDYAGFWNSSSLKGKSLPEKLAILIPFFQTLLNAFPNLAGIIISPAKGPLGNYSVDPIPEPIEQDGGIAVRCLLPAGNQIQECIIVPQVGQSLNSARIFAHLYSHEDAWLNWALDRLEKRPFPELVRENI